MLRLGDDPEAVAQAALDEVAAASAAALAARGRFTIALSGGSTPQTLYRLMADPAAQGRFEWARTHVFFGDERAVPPDHPASNFGMARRALLAAVPLPAAQVHRMAADAPDRGRAAGDYAATLARELGVPPEGPPPALDLVLLGLGADGHTASLFPGQPAVHEAAAWVVPARAPVPPHERLTLTPPVLIAARRVLFLVTGALKAKALAAVLAGPRAPDRYPAQILLAGTPDRVLWLADRAAARELQISGAAPPM